MEKILIVDTLKDVDELEWNSITGSNPFLQFYFLTALRETGCAASKVIPPQKDWIYK